MKVPVLVSMDRNYSNKDIKTVVMVSYGVKGLPTTIVENIVKITYHPVFVTIEYEGGGLYRKTHLMIQEVLDYLLWSFILTLNRL